MAMVEESIIELPNGIRDNEFIDAGLSAWVHRLDAVTKSYSSGRAGDRATEIAIYKRLESEESWPRGILRFYGVLDELSIVLQFAPHDSIRKYYFNRRTQSQRVPLSTKLQWAEQLTGAVAFLHSKGILHCDISCNNVLFDKDLNAVVGDFAGSSLDGKEFFSWYETSHCPPDVMEPSVKTEIFALGSTLCEMLLQHKPFEGADEHLIEDAFRRGQFPSLESLPALEIPIAKCWGQQYETVDDLLQDIKEEGEGQ